MKNNINIRLINQLTAVINKSDISKRLFSGFSWTLIGTIIGKFLQLISFIIVARLLGKEDYGKISIIRSTLSMFLMFSTLGMGTTATRYISLYRNKEPQKALSIYHFANKVTFVFGFIIAALLFLFSSFVAEHSLHNPALANALKISAVALFFLSISAAQIGALNGFEDFKAVGIQSIINGFLQFIFIIIGAYYWGINGTIFALALSALVICYQYCYSLKPNIKNLKEKIEIIEKADMFSIFFKFSLPALLAGIATIPVLWWTKTMLINQSGYGEMAIYDVAEQWYFVLLFIPNALSSITLPLLTNTTADGTAKQYKYLIKVNLSINIGITVLFALGIGFFSPFINKFYGKEFTNYIPMIILLVTAVICAANNVLGQIIASKGKMWIGFGLNSLWAFWLILFSLLFIGKLKLGAAGLAYAMLVSYILHSIVQSIVAVKVNFLSNQNG